MLQNLEDAHLLDQSGRLSVRRGCLGYACPEMTQPGNFFGKAADMWSLGVILFILLEGHHPFLDTTLPPVLVFKNPELLLPRVTPHVLLGSLPDWLPPGL